MLFISVRLPKTFPKMRHFRELFCPNKASVPTENRYLYSPHCVSLVSVHGPTAYGLGS